MSQPTPAGWYSDPAGQPDLQRWWDGSRWTDHTRPASEAAPPAPATPTAPVPPEEPTQHTTPDPDPVAPVAPVAPVPPPGPPFAPGSPPAYGPGSQGSPPAYGGGSPPAYGVPGSQGSPPAYGGGSPQQGYGAQPGYGQPYGYGQPQQKNRTGLIAVIAIAVVVLLGGGGAAVWALTSKDKGSSGGDGKVSADSWAAKYCPSAATWLSSMQKDAKDIETAGNDSTSSAADLKTRMASDLDDIAKASDAHLTDVQHAGTPDVPDGQKAVNDYTTNLKKVRDAAATARDQVNALDTTDEAEFRIKLAGILLTASGEFTDAGKSFQDLQSPQLEAALQKNSTCQSLESLISS
jgi:Protein of unknown function (DUF2510)